MKKVNTLRFGEIEVEEEKVVHFEDGIPAFEDEHEFLIIPYDDESPYVFLQSITTPDLAFLMTMPFVFFPEYEFELDDDSQNKLGIKTQEEGSRYDGQSHGTRCPESEYDAGTSDRAGQEPLHDQA